MIWLFCFSHLSLKISEFAFQFSERNYTDFDWDCIESLVNWEVFLLCLFLLVTSGTFSVSLSASTLWYSMHHSVCNLLLATWLYLHEDLYGSLAKARCIICGVKTVLVPNFTNFFFLNRKSLYFQWLKIANICLHFFGYAPLHHPSSIRWSHTDGYPPTWYTESCEDGVTWLPVGIGWQYVHIVVSNWWSGCFLS